MEVHHFLTLYLTSPTAVTVDAVQGDGVRVLAARLMEGAEPWPVPEGVTAGISYELPGKQNGYYDQLPDGEPACMIAGNLVTAAIDGSLTATAGNVKLSIILRDSDGGQVATFPVTMRVAKRPGRIGAEEMAPPNAYEGKLLMGGRGGETVPVAVGSGLFLERTLTGATLSAPGGGDPDAPGGPCDCGAPYIAGEEPPEDTGALWVDTSEQGEAVALGATVKETDDGVEIYATDELGTTRATVRHGKDGAPGAPGAKGDPGDPGAPGAAGTTPHIGANGNWWIGTADTGKPSRGADGATPTKGVDYFTPADVAEIAEQAAGLVEVPGGGGGSSGWEVVMETILEQEAEIHVKNLADVKEAFVGVLVPPYPDGNEQSLTSSGHILGVNLNGVPVRRKEKAVVLMAHVWVVNDKAHGWISGGTSNYNPPDWNDPLTGVNQFRAAGKNANVSQIALNWGYPPGTYVYIAVRR